MTRLMTLTAMVFTVCLAAGAASAQEVYAIRQDIQAPSVIQDHASTAEEGFLRGSADFVRSAGDYNYSTSLALINREIARDKYLDNRIKAVQTYFELRRINQDYRADQNGPKPTQQDHEKYAKERAPDRLNNYQFDSALGRLYWPTVFLGSDFDAYREAIDELMADRKPHDSGVGSKNHHDIRRVTQAMQELLKTKVTSMSPADYAVANKFLTSLEYEAQVPATPVATIISE